jgi:hypothetical protein
MIFLNELFLVTYDGGKGLKNTRNHFWVLEFGIKFLEIELNFLGKTNYFHIK